MLTPPTRLAEKIAQLLFVRIGSNMKPVVSVEDDADRIEALIDHTPIGGLVLFNGDMYRTPGTLSRLQARSRFPLLVGTDMERGVGQQLKGATVFPHAMAFQAGGDGALARLERFARIAAREALAAGIHIGFLPVADVASNPRNPIISTRAYGTDPGTVSGLVRACVRTFTAEGLLTTAKHFPGHGDTDTDSHETLPHVSRPRAELDALELPPFRAAIEEGVPLIMTAHVAYEALDASGRSATESGPILLDLLRHEMRFRGAVITDSLLMEGAGGGGESRGAWAAQMIRSGIDILLDVQDAPGLVDELTDQVQRGELDEAVVDAALQRVWALKARMAARFGKGVFVDPSLAHPFSVIGCDEHREATREIADSAVRVLSSRVQTLIPRSDLPGPTRTLGLFIRPHTTYNDPTAGAFEQNFLKAFPQADVQEIGPNTPPDVLERILKTAADYAFILAAVVVKPAAWHRFGLLPGQTTFVQELTRNARVVVASLGSPVALDDFPDASVTICTYSDVEPSILALVCTLVAMARGEVPATHAH